MPLSPAPKRVDLHCHSSASNVAGEAALQAIGCPESYSDPLQVYQLARARGMDFVTITDHDTLAGVLTVAHRPDVIVGEELTCYFPEDRCKMHLVLWGIHQADHAALQASASDIYRVAAYVEQHRIAHAVAHPLYRQNDRLEAWHLERLLLLFKGFECLNGAHSNLHRDAFEPMLNALSRERIDRLCEKHMLAPRWPEPWHKSRTGGSDDHGLLNIGRTWTEFPADVRGVPDVLQCLREGRCRPGGQAGSAVKLAHNLFGVAVRFFSRRMTPPGTPLTLPAMLMQTLVGERPAPKRRQLIKLLVKQKLKGFSSRFFKPWKKKESAGGSGKLLTKAFVKSAKHNLREHPELMRALRAGQAPLSQHEEMFKLVNALNRDVAAAIADGLTEAVHSGRFTAIFDAVSAILAQQFILLPYYFSFFHQNRERALLSRLTGLHRGRRPEALRVGLFTDTLDEVNGVARFIRDMGEQAHAQQRCFIVHTCVTEPRLDLPWRKNFQPMLSRRLPYYPELPLNLPPIVEVMEWADRQQFDAIHVSTPGAMGLCGVLVARMLGVPLLMTYHTDFPRYVDNLTHDHRLTSMTTGYMRWLYHRAARVFSRSREYRSAMLALGVPEERLLTTLPGINTDKFSARHRDEGLWDRLGVTQKHKLLYCGRVSTEKNLPLLVDAFQRLCARRGDAALVVAGDGPYLEAMRQKLAGLPAYFLGYQQDTQLGSIYASADLFVFPSRTDTLGQVVMEAQSSGLPVLVSDEGGPHEMMEDRVSGLVLSGTEPAPWVDAIDRLLHDPERRKRMGAAGIERIAHYSLANTFSAFWAEHVRAALPADAVSTGQTRPQPAMA